jgi:LmbE family N-acetylglucosaminyl deacetylase
MPWIYLSPHLDDAVYSCGGLIWEQTQAGEGVEIWTVCAGDPPPGPLAPFAQALHARWGTDREAVRVRRVEDARAAARVGAEIRHFPLADCIYRRAPSGNALYGSEEAIFGAVHVAEQPVVDWLSGLLAQIPVGARLVCPLTLGGHVDHHLVRRAAEQAGRISAFYPDFPYAARGGGNAENCVPAGWGQTVAPLSEAALQAWVEGAALYASQLSTFWADHAALGAEYRAYARQHEGIRLWTRSG